MPRTSNSTTISAHAKLPFWSTPPRLLAAIPPPPLFIFSLLSVTVSFMRCVRKRQANRPCPGPHPPTFLSICICHVSSPKRKSSCKQTAYAARVAGMEGRRRRWRLESSTFERSALLRHWRARACIDTRKRRKRRRTTYYFCRLWWKLESCATRRAIKMHTTRTNARRERAGGVTSARGRALLTLVIGLHFYSNQILCLHDGSIL